MTLRFRRTLVALAMLVLVATACSSSSGDDVDTAAGTDSDPAETVQANDEAEAEAETETETEDPATDATSIPVPADDGAAEDAIAGLDNTTGDPAAEGDPEVIIRDFARSGFNIEPEPAWIQCMIDEADQDDALAAAIRKPSITTGVFDDTDLRALATAMNGCIATISLADWATQAISPQGEVRETAPPCFTERFDASDGDLVFYNFVALTYQNRLEPSSIDSLIDALTACAPITSLSDFFAGQAEQATNFETVIDRECLTNALSPTEVSQDFWTVFVNGGSPPVAFITPFTEDCSEDPNAGLEPTVPEDFEPWSGTGALASVVPAARNGGDTEPPPSSLEADTNYQAVIATGGGEIRIDLYAESAPLTVNNFVSLARDGYYDGTVFHRVLDDFMAQGGDPTGTGTGGPGYQFADEFDGGERIDRKGILAMANSGPNTNGSQFFITFVPTDNLTGLHTAFGEVVEGIEILDAIQRRDPSAPSGRGQLIDSITIIES